MQAKRWEINQQKIVPVADTAAKTVWLYDKNHDTNYRIVVIQDTPDQYRVWGWFNGKLIGFENQPYQEIIYTLGGMLLQVAKLAGIIRLRLSVPQKPEKPAPKVFRIKEHIQIVYDGVPFVLCPNLKIRLEVALSPINVMDDCMLHSEGTQYGTIEMELTPPPADSWVIRDGYKYLTRPLTYTIGGRYRILDMYLSAGDEIVYLGPDDLHFKFLAGGKYEIFLTRRDCNECLVDFVE